MSAEIQWRHTATGETLYATIRSKTGQQWNTAGTPNFEALTVANWTDYDIALTETPASSYFFVGAFPAIAGNMVAGWYWVDVFKRLGAGPTISDTLLGTVVGYWDGTTFGRGTRTPSNLKARLPRQLLTPKPTPRLPMQTWTISSAAQLTFQRSRAGLIWIK